ncbi:MAG: penicillin acylase family protein [Cyclobacteriaceae bacterium]|nr:penicillin acylase family protein [Cyclobacteriaceae bacterium]
MKQIKAALVILFSISVILALDRSWRFGNIRIPPPGKFLDPFQGFWQNAEGTTPDLPKHVQLPQGKQPVTIYWDSLLIPHIFAQNDYDLYAAQGYITALHRLWQMEFQTHAAAGRLGEILGPGTDNAILNYDRKQRRFGMVFAAENAVKGMEKNAIARNIITAYTDGVNACIHSLRYRDLPLEYKLLDYYPEPWTNLKAALLLRSMAQTLNMGDKDFQNTLALKLFGYDTLNLLYPDREAVGDAIVEKPGQWNFNEISAKTYFPSGAAPRQWNNYPVDEAPLMASNNWAVSGSKTNSGFPILCNDPHLNTTLPSIWYAIHLHAPGINTMGVSLPGAPGVIIGFNDSIAWGVTNAQRDLVDWYEIRFDEKRNNYLLDGKWQPVTKRIEKFQIRDKGLFTDTVYYTHWGPVPYDENFEAADNRKHYAFRWIAHDESEEVMTFYYLNRAGNYSDFTKALRYYSSPAQNFIFASVKKDIAIRIQGKFPLRGKDEGRFVLDGTLSASSPAGYIPFEHNISDKNPARGFVSSANQYPADSTYPYYITAVSYEAYRNRRINNRLREMNKITPEDMMKLQNDNFSIKAAEALPLMLNALNSADYNEQEKKIIDDLRLWNYTYDAHLSTPCYFDAWWSNLYSMLWDEMRSENLSLSYPTSFTTIRLMKKYPNLRFYDRRDTPEKEELNDLIRMAFRSALDEVEKWKAAHPDKPLQWAWYKDTYIEHLLRQEAFSRHVLHGGHANAVNASSRKHGPSWRMIISLEPDNLQAYAVYPGGQSGNPGSAFYDNMLQRWATGRYFRLSFYRNEEEAKNQAMYTTQISP